jgi:hypothetical protein
MTSLVEKGKLTAEDQADLKRIRRILCLPADIAKKVGGILLVLLWGLEYGIETRDEC